jgi:transcriptional regulator with XRE-family HTH domain
VTTSAQLIEFLDQFPEDTPVFLTEEEARGAGGFAVAVEPLLSRWKEDGWAPMVSFDPQLPGYGFIELLKKRMARYGISQNVLAREMGKTPPEISRWFTKNPARRVDPSLDTIEHIYKAMVRLTRRRKVQSKEEIDRFEAKAICPQCKYVNELEAELCFGCGAPRPPGTRN